MKNLFSDDNSGYRLKTLQILNWGVFDEKVKTFEFDNKSTILTGYNGSGKTTCVDAILTLLIPTSLRWYNLSSESVKKRERDVDNYVLGAWGNTGDSGTKFLRDKTTVSIINGIFNDPVNEKYISLLQVRYFVGDRLDTKYAITEKELRLEKASQALNAKGFSINSDGKWRKILTEEYDTRFYDTFSSYKTFFMDKFGFRSDNALKLFSQTVGMKVLGDMTSFVRSYMLEDKTPEKEFKDLDTEFINLLSIDKDLRKAQLKLEKLEKIHSSIEKWQKAEEEMKTAEQNRIGEELWFYKNAASFGEKEVIERERKIKEKEENRVYYSNEIERVNEIIFSLSQDTSTSLIDALEREIKVLKEKLSEIIERYNQYQKLITTLNKDGMGVTIPETRESFYHLKDSIPLYQNKINDKKDRYEDTINEYNIKISDIKKRIQEYEEQLEYLSNRETNIPKEYDEIRIKIASFLSLDADALPFLGELVTINEDSGEWRIPILKLLNAHALDLLVDKEHETKIAEFLDYNDVGLDIKVIVVDERLFMEDKDNALSHFIEIREKKNPYKKWLKNYIAEISDFETITSIEELIKKERAIGSSSLIKEDDEIIKYDRKDINGLLKNYLGWDNREKRVQLEQYIRGQEDEKEDFENKLRSARYNREKCSTVLYNISRLNEYDEWTLIDTKTVDKVLKEQEEKRRNLLKKNKDLFEKKKKLEEEKSHKYQLEMAKEEIVKEKGILESSLIKLIDDLSQIKEKLRNLEWNEEAYNSFTINYQKEISIFSLDDIYSTHKELKDRVDEIRNVTKEDELNCRTTLEKQMEDFTNPSFKSVENELNWSGEYSEFSSTADSYMDYENEYLKIKDEDIYNLKQKFNNYLTSSLIKNLGQLNEKIRSWDKEIKEAIKILNRNLTKIPFNKDLFSHIQLEIKNSVDKDHQEFYKILEKALPNARYLSSEDEAIKKDIYTNIKNFLDKYRSDDMLRKKVLDIRRKYDFTAKEINGDGSVKQYYKDTGALSGGEKAKLTYTILAASIAYQFNLDDYSESNKGPFRFVILDEAFSKSDAKNSIYALELFKELDLQLMVVTPRNGINIVEGYVSTLHLLEKDEDKNTTTLSSMTIKEYEEGVSASIF